MMMRRLVTALVMSLLGSAIFTFWLSRKLVKPTAAQASLHRYVAPATNLEAGQVLGKDNLKVIDWGLATTLDGAYSKVEDVSGRTLLYPVASGEPVLEHHLAAAGSGIGMLAKIPDGMRAISLRSDQIVGVAGFMLPGTRVDVLVTYHSPTGQSAVTAIVLQDVQILATGQKMQPDPEGKATNADVVTLLVTPQDAEKVVLASAQGTVHFVLRNGSDHQVVADSHAQLPNMNESARRTPSPVAVVRAATTRKEPVAEPQQKTYHIQTVNGDKQSVESFQ